MRHNTDRILVSHAGNLPRPADVDRLIASGDQAAFHKRLPTAVVEIVDRQAALGVDVVNDGEFVKAGSYGGYIHSRLGGFEQRPYDPKVSPKRGGVAAREVPRYPGTYASGLWLSGSGGPVRPGSSNPLRTGTDSRRRVGSRRRGCSSRIPAS